MKIYQPPDPPLIDMADVMAELCGLAYEDDFDVNPDNKIFWPFATPSIRVGDTQFRIFAGFEVGAIAIAGTNSLADWATNLQLRPTQQNSGGLIYSVHSGFLKSAQTVLAGVMARDDLPACFRRGNYYITGHSLGGATAALLPLLLEGRLPPPRGVITIGSPNYVISPEQCVLWPAEVLNICSPDDIVTHLPTRIWRPWGKIGQQIYIGDEGFHDRPGSPIARWIRYAAGLTAVAAGLVQRFTCRSFCRTDRNLFGSVHAIAEHDYRLYARRIIAAERLLAQQKGMM